MKERLSNSHRRTYHALFRHPAAHNLHWRDVRSMLGSLADVAEEPNGNFKVTRGGQTLVLRPSPDKDVAEVDQLMEIRHFLERSGAEVPPSTAGDGAHLLVVVDHREARIYRTEVRGSVPQRVTPYDPKGAGRHLHHVEDDSNGQRKPELRSFYEAIAATLRGTDPILIFGGGTGASSAMNQLFADLQKHHPRIAGRVVDQCVVDEPHMTENQLLAEARSVYAKIAAADRP